MKKTIFAATFTMILGTSSFFAQNSPAQQTACYGSRQNCKTEANKEYVCPENAGACMTKFTNCNQQNCNQQNCNQQNNCRPRHCDGRFEGKGRHHGNHCDGIRNNKRFPARALNPMAGIELTEAQKKSLDKAKESFDKSMKKSRSNFDKQIEKILTPQQLQTYKANIEKRKELRERFAKPLPGSKGSSRPGKIEKAEQQPPLTGGQAPADAIPMKK